MVKAALKPMHPGRQGLNRYRIALTFAAVATMSLINRETASAGVLDWLTAPSLSASQQEWHTFHRNVAAKDAGYPLEVLSDGYKLIRAYRNPATSFKGYTRPAQDLVEWGWRIEIRNKSNKDIELWVDYELLDKDNFSVAIGYGTKHPYSTIPAGTTVVIQYTETMDYGNVNRIDHSTFRIKLV